jgi:hypothetical protein
LERKDLRLQLKRSKTKTLDDALQEALEMEASEAADIAIYVWREPHPETASNGGNCTTFPTAANETSHIAAALQVNNELFAEGSSNSS